METILYLCSNTIHLYGIYILFKTILDESRFPKQIEILTYITYFVINSCTYIFIDNLYLNLISNIVPMFLIMLQYKKPLQTNLFLTTSICAIGMFLDWMFACINPSFIFIETNTTQSITFLSLVFLFRHYFKLEEKSIVNSKYILFLIFISIGTIVIAEMLGPEVNRTNFIVTIILLAINLSNFYLYNSYIENMNIKLLFNTIESSNKAYQNQIKLMTESQEKIRLMKHDLRNHLLKIKHDIDCSNYSTASDYINTMIDSVVHEKEYSKTGNADIDYLLNYKLSIADKIGAVISYNIILPNTLKVDSFDLVVILGNLLDNAIQALEKTDVRVLNIDINYSMGIIVIKIENTFSTKDCSDERNSEHGFGIKSIRTSLKKYNGSLQNDVIDNMYVAKAVICNIEKKGNDKAAV